MSPKRHQQPHCCFAVCRMDFKRGEEPNATFPPEELPQLRLPLSLQACIRWGLVAALFLANSQQEGRG
ncbi:hypothetical protein LEMLEM_LOCUS20193, partial [Lemmus lemmus]